MKVIKPNFFAMQDCTSSVVDLNTVCKIQKNLSKHGGSYPYEIVMHPYGGGACSHYGYVSEESRDKVYERLERDFTSSYRQEKVKPVQEKKSPVAVFLDVGELEIEYIYRGDSEVIVEKISVARKAVEEIDHIMYRLSSSSTPLSKEELQVSVNDVVHRRNQIKEMTGSERTEALKIIASKYEQNFRKEYPHKWKQRTKDSITYYPYKDSQLFGSILVYTIDLKPEEFDSFIRDLMLSPITTVAEVDALLSSYYSGRNDLERNSYKEEMTSPSPLPSSPVDKQMPLFDTTPESESSVAKAILDLRGTHPKIRYYYNYPDTSISLSSFTGVLTPPEAGVLFHIIYPPSSYFLL